MTLTKKEIRKLKQKLEEEKANIKKELGSFASPDPNLAGDYDTRFPNFHEDPATDPLDNAAEVEAMEEALPVEHVLETRLQKIEKALEKINESTYGVCENCGKEISSERLGALPEAGTCFECSSS